MDEFWRKKFLNFQNKTVQNICVATAEELHRSFSSCSGAVLLSPAVYLL